VNQERIVISSTSVQHRAYSPEPQDLVVAAASVIFASASFALPDTGTLGVLGKTLPRGLVMGPVFLVAAVAAGLAGFLPSSAKPGFFPFIRLFYPQALIPVFFDESILLSARAFGGAYHDAAFAAADQWIFGFQPAREFHKAFMSSPAVNELMFASYFLFYVVLTATPWIAWLSGKREEGRSQLFISLTSMLAASTFYIFFRVMGPKYFLPDLREAWYGGFKGGFFVAFFQGLFSATVLSGAAFPSTHVALTAISARSAWRTDRRLLPAYLVAGALIMTATIYIYAHYFVDVLGGLAYAALAAPVLSRAYPRLRGLCGAIGAGGRVAAPRPGEGRVDARLAARRRARRDRRASLAGGAARRANADTGRRLGL
jgi:membrane-associated phospholipid phosphatase